MIANILQKNVYGIMYNVGEALSDIYPLENYCYGGWNEAVALWN